MTVPNAGYGVTADGGYGVAAASIRSNRRDKRRQSLPTPTLLELYTPFQLISLAIRFDESRPAAEALLSAPLESGRLYNDQVQFYRALEYLEKKTSPPSALLSSSSSRSSRTSSTAAPDTALTPIVLSGLISVVQGQREEKPTSEQQHHSREQFLACDIVQYCQAMRRAAIRRVKNRKKRQKMQRIVLPICSVLILALLYMRSMADTRIILTQLGYVESCDWVGVYEPACQATEAALWNKYRNYMLMMHMRSPGAASTGNNGVDDGGRSSSTNSTTNSTTGFDHSPLQDRAIESPFAMHTALQQDVITLEELEDSLEQSSAKREPKNTKNYYNHRRDNKKSSSKSLRWLGESNVNRLIREALRQYLKPGMSRHVLDVGCGIGGTLYTLLPMEEEARRQFRYHGITLSNAEITMARQLVQHHGLSDLDISFEQKSFDDPLPSETFSTVVAVESMSYSRTLQRTLTNMVQSLKPGGVLVVVEDVVYPGQQTSIVEEETTRRPSLETNAVWISALRESGCEVKGVRDLGLEYEFVGEAVSEANFGFSSWDILPNTWPLEGWRASLGNMASRRLVELSEERYNLALSLERRKKGFSQGDLAYQMYVCIKPS